MNTALLVVLLSIPAQRPLHLNLKASYEPVDRQLEDEGGAHFLVLGDSLSRKGWTQPFTAQWQALWGNGGAGYQGLSYHNNGGFNGGVWDVHNIAEDREPHSAVDGLWGQTTAGIRSGVSTTAVLTPWQPGPFDLHYQAQPGGGRFQVLEDTPSGRVLRTTIDTEAGASTVATWHGTAAGRLVFQPLDEGKPVKIFGIVGNSTDGHGLRVDRAATDAWSTQNFVQRDATFDQQVSLLGPDLAFIALGANDGANGLPAGYGQRLEAIADRLLADQPDVKIVLMPPYQFNSTATNSSLTDVAIEIAARRGFGLINQYDTLGTHDFFVANNFLRDNIHWNDAGSAYVANVITNALLTFGRSLDNPNADVTGDLTVNLGDFSVLKENFGRTMATMAQGDITRDAKVDLSDFSAMKRGFGAVHAAMAVPEPSCAALLALGAVCCVVFVWKTQD